MSAGSPLRGEIRVPADKSISHRSVMFAAMAKGLSRVKASILGRDNLATIRIIRQLGVEVRGECNSRVLALAKEEHLDGFSESSDEFCRLEIESEGFSALKQPTEPLDCGNSGTSARLLTGFLAGCPFSSTLTGDESLRSRPFKRVTEPLSSMGAQFDGDMLPLTIIGGPLKGISYESPKASAQVKSAILLAGLRAEGVVEVIEPWRSRDHTERMLTAMGCEVVAGATEDGRWRVSLPAESARASLAPIDIDAPGDFSSAAFFLVAGSIVPDSLFRISEVGFNSTRTGLFSILRRMGADIRAYNPRKAGGEEVIDLEISAAELKGIDVLPEDVALAIDEIPILAVAAAFANGVTRISGAEELRVKESDRLTMIAEVLKGFSVEVQELSDGLLITGDPQFRERFREQDLSVPGLDAPWRSSGDHRIAMCGAVLEYALTAKLELSDRAAVETSFPSFVDCFQELIG